MAEKNSTPAQRLNSVYRRQIEMQRRQIVEIATAQSVNLILARTVASLEADNQKLRRYLGKMLYERRMKGDQL